MTTRAPDRDLGAEASILGGIFVSPDILDRPELDTDTTTYASGAIRDACDSGHANTEWNPQDSDSCPACPGVSGELGHERRPACPGPKTRARDTEHIRAPGPDTPEAPRDGGYDAFGLHLHTEYTCNVKAHGCPATHHGAGACGAPRAEPCRTPGTELPRAPGTRQGLFQRDLTSPPTAARPGGAR